MASVQHFQCSFNWGNRNGIRFKTHFFFFFCSSKKNIQLKNNHHLQISSNCEEGLILYSVFNPTLPPLSGTPHTKGDLYRFLTPPDSFLLSQNFLYKTVFLPKKKRGGGRLLTLTY